MNAIAASPYGASPTFGGAAPWSAARWTGAAAGSQQVHRHNLLQGPHPTQIQPGVNRTPAWAGLGRVEHVVRDPLYGPAPASTANLAPWSAQRWRHIYERREGGSWYVNAFDRNEALSGLPYLGWMWGGTTNPNRDRAVDAAIAAGNVRNYIGTRGDRRTYNDGIIGSLTGGTIGAIGDLVGRAVAEIPVIGNNDSLTVSTFSPILNIAFGQRAMSNEQIKRNAIYNFGPRADAYLERGDAFGRGVARGLRGDQVYTPREQAIPTDGIARAINAGLGIFSRMNLPVISYFADAARSLFRGASGESTFDFLNGGSNDPMDPTWTVFGAPVNLMVSGLARRFAPMLGLNQAAMDERFGRAVGDAMNVYDVFLPGDHTRHAMGAHLPRLIAGSPHTSNDHSHHHQFQPADVASNAQHSYVDTWRGVTSRDIGAAGGYRQVAQQTQQTYQTTTAAAAPAAAGGGHQGHH